MAIKFVNINEALKAFNLNMNNDSSISIVIITANILKIICIICYNFKSFILIAQLLCACR